MTRQQKLLAKKGRGRPKTGINPTIGVRMPVKEIAAVDAWRNQQVDEPSRPIAIRRLVELGLSNKQRGAKSP
jgi:hypothetical protein